ncbi:hypothetical protein SAMN02745181_0461 [Rubritalea squalenifaciens DSM 18772]|uniref:GYF domain-containing protein n=1 Tax=Rubritalea squalenifaciens DSM 18772 TaxID=1123071 RepID=A0A1M6CEP8_9BACT|nr:hypothetical protein [Rubritalea squalenifaciens]SHI59500.1 hypothetical protein SAMN02745181_0461 [Rubritalea squalenifaciens DSM 18772]
MEEARYYIKGQEEIGLVDSSSLHQRILNHSLQANSLVRLEDTTQWIKLGSLQVWRNAKAPHIGQLMDELPAESYVQVEDKLEISITIFAYIAFLIAFIILVLGISHGALTPALFQAASAVLSGLLLLAVARILRYLRTLVEQGKARAQED